MKGLLALAVAVAVAVPVFAADHAADEAAIMKVWQQFSDAWGRGDTHAQAALWSQDASLINPFGLKANGRPAIEKVFEQEHAGFAKGTTHTFSDFSFRFLTPSLVEVDSIGEIKGIKGADGAEMPPAHVHVFVVMKKTGGKWMIHDARPYMIAPPPGQPAAAAK
jgi:uncharacterized protein (TIGR02246 family)